MTSQTTDPTTAAALRRAADAIASAEGLLVTAGAGMGVDSGLPDFRGPEGFWRAYPPYRAMGLRFEQLANPAWFARDPAVAWGFYGHRLNLYRATRPHAGFGRLRAWGAGKPLGTFVFTSNVDGQFAAAGFDPGRTVECHGSIHHLQCATPCHPAVWPAEGVAVAVDERTMRAIGPLPACPRCGGVARPDILMFGDGAWVGDRTDAQDVAYQHWRREVQGHRLVVVECGAGTAVPTVRLESQATARRTDVTLVRINVREPAVPPGHVGLPMTVADATARLAAELAGGVGGPSPGPL